MQSVLAKNRLQALPVEWTCEVRLSRKTALSGFTWQMFQRSVREYEPKVQQGSSTTVEKSRHCKYDQGFELVTQPCMPESGRLSIWPLWLGHKVGAKVWDEAQKLPKKHTC